MKRQIFPICEMGDYKEKTTCWNDFCIAEKGNLKEIEKIFKQFFNDLKYNVEMITELSMVLNWKMWEHDSAGNIEISECYKKLWKKTDKWCLENLSTDDLRYYLKRTN